MREPWLLERLRTFCCALLRAPVRFGRASVRATVALWARKLAAAAEGGSTVTSRYCVHKCGRITGSSNVDGVTAQRAPRLVRFLCLDPTDAIDVDVSNCMPTLVYSRLTKEFPDAPARFPVFRRCVEENRLVLAELARFIRQASGVDEDRALALAKKKRLAITNGGGRRHWTVKARDGGQRVPIELLRGLAREMAEVCTRTGRKVYEVYFEEETRVMRAVIDKVVRGDGHVPIFLAFDGIALRMRGHTEEQAAAYWNGPVVDAVRKATGHTVLFKVVAFRPTADEEALLLHLPAAEAPDALYPEPVAVAFHYTHDRGGPKSAKTMLREHGARPVRDVHEWPVEDRTALARFVSNPPPGGGKKHTVCGARKVLSLADPKYSDFEVALALRLVQRGPPEVNDDDDDEDDDDEDEYLSGRHGERELAGRRWIDVEKKFLSRLLDQGCPLAERARLLRRSERAVSCQQEDIARAALRGDPSRQEEADAAAVQRYAPFHREDAIADLVERNYTVEGIARRRRIGVKDASALVKWYAAGSKRARVAATV